MAIIQNTKEQNTIPSFFPNQFVTEKEKSQDWWIKGTMDYFSNVAYSQYVNRKQVMQRNYDILDGKLKKEDFYEDQNVKSFVEILTKDTSLPSHIKNYSIMLAPINQLLGEVTGRPDEIMIRAFDSLSKLEEDDYKTTVLREYVESALKAKVYEKIKASGIEVPEEEINTMTAKEAEKKILSYSSVAEKWGSHILEACKMEFDIKKKEEDAAFHFFRTGHEYYHVYEDNSKFGFNIETVKPTNVWVLSGPDKNFTSDPSGRMNSAYAAGIIRVMEISEIIEAFPQITKEEIEHLIENANSIQGILSPRESNLSTNETGPGSIKYDTYDPLVLNELTILQSELGIDSSIDFLGVHPNIGSFGYKYLVNIAYFASKRKIGKLTYLDEFGLEQTVFVDESYREGTHPTEVSVEWGWINQWYKGLKIGTDVYHIEPLKLFNYCPIIGVGNITPLVEHMKPFQIIYNVCMNQLFELLGKEIGNVAAVNIRRVPRTKDGDPQDDIEIFEAETREKGILYDDDSIENTKVPVSNQTVARNVDLSRTSEIQSRYNLAAAIKNECWSIIGMNRERLGSISATQTATGVNAAINQSYTQTEYMMSLHDYVKVQLYQAILDAALYIESSKPESVLSYVNSNGESMFVSVNGSDIKLRNLLVYVTNRNEDKRTYNEVLALSNMLANRGEVHPYDVISMKISKSFRELMKNFKESKEKYEQMQAQESQIRQQELENDRMIKQVEIQLEREKMMFEAQQRELDRIKDKEVAIINATRYGNVNLEDADKDKVFDIMETQKMIERKQEIDKDIQLKERKLDIEEEKLRVARENMKNDLEIAKENAKNRKKK